MTEQRDPAQGQIPLGQRIFDSPFLLLLAGFFTATVMYTVWGLIEILTLPQSPLP
jgi:hypothetical protein